MHTFKRFGALTVAASVLAGPAFAQGNAPAPAAPAPAVVAPGVAAPGVHTAVPASPAAPRAATTAAPSERNPVLTDAGDARASKLIGTSVYNDRNDKIGTVDDVLLRNGAPVLVLSVGGFLGMGNHYVSVPYSTLRFGDVTSGGNRLVMAGATKDSLKAMPEYSYTAARRT